MITVSGKEFARACVAQDVGLNELLLEVLQANPQTASGMPTRLLGALGGAADTLVGRPDEPLASGANLQPTLRMRLDPVAKYLARVINYSRQPLKESFLPNFELMSDRSGDLDSCPTAEYYFLNTIAALGDNDELGGQIIVDEAGPIMLRKNEGEPSALTLREVVIAGVPWPAGMLVSVQLRNKPPRYKNNDGQVEVYPKDQVESVAPMRLSAFGISPLRRRLDFMNLYPFTDDDDNETFFNDPNYMRMTVEEIGRVAALFVADEIVPVEVTDTGVAAAA